MTSLKVFLPRSPVSLGLALFVFVSGVALPPVIETLAEAPRPWMHQYLASVCLAILGISLGNTLVKVRGWEPAYLVPGLNMHYLWMAMILMSALYGIYLSWMLFENTLYGLPWSLSLAIGMLALLMGSGIHRRSAQSVDVVVLLRWWTLS